MRKFDFSKTPEQIKQKQMSETPTSEKQMLEKQKSEIDRLLNTNSTKYLVGSSKHASKASQTDEQILAKNRSEHSLDDPKGISQAYNLWNDIWNNPKNVEKWRAEWAKTCNKYLAPDHQIDHRSFERQGKKQIPTIHEGYVARKMEREAAGSSERASFNQIVKYINNELKSLRKQIRGIIREIRNLEKGRDQDHVLYNYGL